MSNNTVSSFPSPSLPQPHEKTHITHIKDIYLYEHFTRVLSPSSNFRPWKVSPFLFSKRREKTAWELEQWVDLPYSLTFPTTLHPHTSSLLLTKTHRYNFFLLASLSFEGPSRKDLTSFFSFFSFSHNKKTPFPFFRFPRKKDMCFFSTSLWINPFPPQKASFIRTKSTAQVHERTKPRKPQKIHPFFLRKTPDFCLIYAQHVDFPEMAFFAKKSVCVLQI